MNKFSTQFTATFLSLALVMVCSLAKANPTKEFITSCTYGVLTGTLVGVASLAFTDQPGDNLQNVARGASLGLYLGVALGVYVAYIVPGQQNEQFIDPEGFSDQGSSRSFKLIPLITEQGIEGVYANWTLAQF